MARDLNCWRISCTSTRRWSSHSSCGLRKRNICMKFLPHSHGWVEEHRTTVCEDSIHTFHTVCTSSAASVLEAGLRVLIWAWNIRARAPGYHQGSGSFVTVEDRINVDHFFLFFFFFFCLSVFFLTGCDPQGICGWRKSSEQCILQVLRRLLTRISREGQFVSYVWRYPSSFCCESESLLTNHGVMQISQPPYLPDLMPADIFPLKWKPPPSTIKKGRFQDIDDDKSNITAELKDFFFFGFLQQLCWAAFRKL